MEIADNESDVFLLLSLKSDQKCVKALLSQSRALQQGELDYSVTLSQLSLLTHLRRLDLDLL